MEVAALIFDLDGVLVDSEARWDAARRAVVAEAVGTWTEEATSAMQGMSAPEWERYLVDELGASLEPAEAGRRVVTAMADGYREDLPLLPGAVAAVRRCAEAFTLGVASSANASIVALALELAGVDGCFAARCSSEEVARGKPAPDVYVETARRLGVEPAECVAVEDSTNGLRSAHAAGMAVIATPTAAYPPAAAALALAGVVLDDGVAALTPDVVRRARAR